MEEEVEIKIEYNENYEHDPLCQNSNLRDETYSEIRGPSSIQDSGNNEDVVIEKPQVIPKKVEERGLQKKLTPVKVDKLPIVEVNKNGDAVFNTQFIEKVQWYKSIDSKGRYICKFCNLPYYTIQTVRRHTLTKHPDEANKLKDKIAKNNRSYNKCHICKMKFAVLDDLQNHLKIKHSIGVSHFCHKCQGMFEDNESLLNHLAFIHKIVGLNIYVCLSCGYKTYKVSHFNQHQKIHTLSKTHKCDYCNYATNNIPNLRIHERIHKKTKKPFKCMSEGCSYAAVTLPALRSHELIHSKDKHFRYCDKCTYKTVYKQSLKKHIDSHVRNTIKTIA